nr:immunoglobulin heavy chain junction region [Mus musculus]
CARRLRREYYFDYW